MGLYGAACLEVEWACSSPPAGLLVTAGPILGVFLSGVGLGAAGAVTVAALDGIISALIHLGMPREMVTLLGERLHNGDTLLIVHGTSADRPERTRVLVVD